MAGMESGRENPRNEMDTGLEFILTLRFMTFWFPYF